MEKKWIDRDIVPKIRQLADEFPVVTLTGPRQSGKTTLCRELFPDYHYVNLENVAVREQIQADTLRFLDSCPGGIVVDEAHHYPDLFSYVQVCVDEHPGRRFVLTGSSNFALLEKSTQSLAGRTAVLTLLPLSLRELGDRVKSVDTDTLILNGGYPAVWGQGRNPVDLYMAYYTTYVERDVRQIVNVRDMTAFQKFVRLAAGRIGAECNAHALAGEVGVAANTVSAWFSVLAASYIVYMLPPYYENIGKRLKKTAKLYFYDTGLACSLLGIETVEQLRVHPLRGALFENMVVSEAVKSRFNAGRPLDLYFYRDSTQKEVDLLRMVGRDFYAYEIKSAGTYHSEFAKGLNYLKALFGERVKAATVVYDGDTSFNAVNFRDFRLA